MEEHQEIALTVNGAEVRARVPVRQHLIDFLRMALGLTGSHLGCEHGVCGACTVLVDDMTARSCLMFAVQADGCSIRTVESLATPTGDLNPLQQAFQTKHGLQCGYCTPGMLIAGQALLARNPDPSEAEIRDAISGNLCRCTGYQQIVEAIAEAGKRLRDGDGP